MRSSSPDRLIHVELPAVLLLVSGDAELVIGRLPACTPDVALVGWLARLQLAAKRHRCSIRVLVTDDELIELVELTGLADVLAVQEVGR